MKSAAQTERINTVIIGGGQAGLSTGYHLSRRNVPFVILEANGRIGDTWRARWDSLRLFTPAKFDGLDGLPFPAPAQSFPTKDEMGNYLEAYAAKFRLPVRTGVRVDRVTKEGNRYLVSAGDRRFDADNVVIAMSSYQEPRVPAFAGELSPGLVQLHSKQYRSPDQLRPGGVLIVGAGNSGAEIAIDVARAGHQTWMSGRATGHLPFRIESVVARVLSPFLFRVIFHRILTVDTPIGRKARPKIIAQGAPLIRQKPKDLAAAGIQQVPRTTGTKGGLPVLADGRVLEVTNVIWCTGFKPGVPWLELPVFEPDGEPRHLRGLVPDEPGLSFVGLHFLYSMSSTMIHGVGRDAERIASAVAARQPAPSPAARLLDTLPAAS
ncbi:MAG TPA: NAD(P)-binding domain-containing protein [Gemmatimonadales bacterium]|nr:NAD(P)-binding domain-containing protein [Gemmatimonadales bacterium]